MVEKKELEVASQPAKPDKKVQQDLKVNGKLDKSDGIKSGSKRSTESTKNEAKSDEVKSAVIEVQSEAPSDEFMPNLKTNSNYEYQYRLNNRKERDLNNHPRKEELRAKVLEYIKENPDDFDLCDQDLLRKSDLWMNRFLNFRNQSFENAYNQLIETFKWRKDFEVNTFDKTITPIEAWLSGGVFLYAPDKNGNPVLYMRGSMHHRIEERFYKLFQKLLAILLENIDRLGNREFGWTCVLDLNGVGWSNVDVEMIHFLLNTSRTKYPNGCKWCIIHGLPWFLNYIAKGIFAALPSDSAAKIKFVSGSNYRQLSVNELISTFDLADINNNFTENRKKMESEEEKKRVKLPIEEYIDICNLPDFLGGTCRVNYRIAPKGSMTAMKIGQTRFNLDEAKIKQLMKPFQKTVDAAHKTLAEFRTANFQFEFDYDNIIQELEKYTLFFSNSSSNTTDTTTTTTTATTKTPKTPATKTT